LKYFIPALIALIFSACSTSTGDDVPMIVLSETPILSTNVELEIGDSETYLAGNIASLVVMDDGTMLISDYASVTIEQFSPEGEHMGTVAVEGGGPGELSNYFFLTNAGNDTLIARQQSSMMIYYGRNGDGLFTFGRSFLPERSGDRTYNMIGAKTENEFYATSGQIVRNVEQTISNPVDYRESALLVVDGMNKVLRDSLHMLKTPNPHLVMMGGGFSVWSVPYRFQDRVVLLDDGGYMIARPDSSYLAFYDSNHQLTDTIPLSIAPRPITREDTDFALRNVRSEVKREIEARVDDNKPPYLNLWASDNYIWLHTDTTEEGKEFLVINHDGEAAGRIMFSEYDTPYHFTDERIYTLHKDPEMGDVIRVYSIDF
jgi:hypothetical protein